MSTEKSTDTHCADHNIPDCIYCAAYEPDEDDPGPASTLQLAARQLAVAAASLDWPQVYTFAKQIIAALDESDTGGRNG